MVTQQTQRRLNLIGLLAGIAAIIGIIAFKLGAIMLAVLALGLATVAGMAAYVKLESFWVRALGLLLFGLGLLSLCTLPLLYMLPRG